MSANRPAAVRMSDKNLTEIPEEILKRDDIRTLDLSRNTGIRLSGLKNSQLKNVRKLMLEQCGLLEMPDDISELTQLEELYLSFNLFSDGFKPNFGPLRRLKKLYLRKCHIRALPESIGALEHLEELDLSSNQLCDIRNLTFRGLRDLKKLNLGGCGLTTLPESLENLELLEELNLARNRFSEGLNPAIGGLRRLKKLDLGGCELRAVPETLGDLKLLEELYLSKNLFGKGLNPTIGRLRRLRKLDLGACGLRTVPDSLGDLELLEELYLSKNLFCEGLNPTIGRLRRLRKLDLGACGLPTVPDSLGDLELLEELHLSENHFLEGCPAIKRLHRLSVLDIGSCELRAIPEWLGDLEMLEQLSLRNNTFCEGLDPAIGRLRLLKTLLVDNCELINLPDEIQNLEQLEVFCLGNGQHYNLDFARRPRHYEAAMRADFHECEHKDKKIRSNNFSDGLNSAIGGLKRLEYLVLDGCKLKTLPESMGDLEKLEALILRNNSLEEYPRCTLRLKNLLNIDLSNRSDIDGNRIKNLPVELAFTNIVNLELKGNPITEPPKEVWSQGAQAVRSFMRAVLPGGELMHADTLNMIGDTGAGKSSVTLSLIANSPQRTEDAHRTHLLQQCRWSFEVGLGRCVIINDFGGDDSNRSVMPIFLSTNGLIILVCNLVDERVEEQVKKWMLTALAKFNEFRLIVVGTHADLLTNVKAHENFVACSDQRSAFEERIKCLSSRYIGMALDEVYAHNRHLGWIWNRDKLFKDNLRALYNIRETLKSATVSVVTLSCSVDDGGLRRLRDVVTRSLRPPHILPVRWCRFMTTVLKPDADLLYIAFREVERLSREYFTEDDGSNAHTTVLRYLVETSQIIWLENHPFLKDFIFHSPQKIINTCEKIFHHDNVVSSSLTYYDDVLHEYSKGILQEPLLRMLLYAQTKNQNASEALHPELFEVVVSFLQHFNLISFVKKTGAVKQFIVPCKLTATEPQEMLLELEKGGSGCLNRVIVRLTFLGSIIPLSLFETSLSSILNVTGDLSQHVEWPKVWKDGAIIVHNGVTLITKRIDSVISLTAFSEPSSPSPWTILQPVLKRLYENVRTSWHGAPPACAIVCPWCERQKPSNAITAQIKIDLTILVAEDKPYNGRPWCAMCVRAIPPSLCFPTMETGSLITYQSEIEAFFRVAVAKRKQLLQDDGGPSKVPKQLESGGNH